MSGNITVAVVDDHPLVGDGLRAVIEAKDAGICVAVTAASVAELVERGCPSTDAALLDIRLADESRARDNVHALMAWGARVLVYTQGDQVEEVLEALQAGALGVVHKQDPIADLMDAIAIITSDELRVAEDGAGELKPGQYISRRLAQALEVLAERSPAANLTPQELEVIRLYASGLIGKHVARFMNLSEGTVKTYLKRSKDKLIQAGYSAGTKHEIRTAAIRLGIVPPVDADS